jgi:hypothetical protein
MEAVVKFQVHGPAGSGAIGRSVYIEIASRNLSVQGNRETAENQSREKKNPDSPHRASTVLADQS